MGYYAHHAVIVHARGYVWNQRISPTPVPEVARFRDALPAEFQPLVIGPVPTSVNGDYVFAFLPDGSKEGWDTSDAADRYRQQFIDLFRWQYDDGSSPFDVAVIRFGGDEPERAWIEQRPNVFSPGQTVGGLGENGEHDKH